MAARVTGFMLEPWQREFIEARGDGQYRRVLLNKPRRRSGLYEQTAADVALHGLLYGCDVRILDHAPYWQCERGAECPQIAGVL